MNGGEGEAVLIGRRRWPSHSHWAHGFCSGKRMALILALGVWAVFW